MAELVRVNLDARAIRALGRDPFTVREILDAGNRLARLAASGAPKLTGKGAASIDAELSTRDPGWAEVSWSNEYPYMIFHEDGTRYVPAAGFLRAAFESYIHF